MGYHKCKEILFSVKGILGVGVHGKILVSVSCIILLLVTSNSHETATSTFTSNLKKWLQVKLKQ
jgi:hypothetical protein